MFPFAATALIADDLWMLAVQEKDFDPIQVYENPGQYTELPFDKENGPGLVDEYMEKPVPRHQLIGRVGLRWVLFEMSMRIR